MDIFDCWIYIMKNMNMFEQMPFCEKYPGVFEFDNFAGGSKAIADAIAEATKEGAFSLIGGGDSVACINKFGLADQVSYISTGGGALLEAIEGKVLPGVAAIEK